MGRGIEGGVQIRGVGVGVSYPPKFQILSESQSQNNCGTTKN